MLSPFPTKGMSNNNSLTVAAQSSGGGEGSHGDNGFGFVQYGHAASAAFNGGLISSDGGLVHSLSGMLRFRMFAIACGYEDADDCDRLRADPLFKLALGEGTGELPRLLFTAHHEPPREHAVWH